MTLEELQRHIIQKIYSFPVVLEEYLSIKENSVNDILSEKIVSRPDNFLYKKTLLIQAARNSYLDAVILLIEKKANIDVQDQKGVTALIYAIKIGNINIIEYLLQHGANPNHQTLKGDIPLSYANQNEIGEDHSIIISRCLLRYSADINFFVKSSARERKSVLSCDPLCLAISFHKFKLITFLIEHGVNSIKLAVECIPKYYFREDFYIDNLLFDRFKAAGTYIQMDLEENTIDGTIESVDWGKIRQKINQHNALIQHSIVESASEIAKKTSFPNSVAELVGSYMAPPSILHVFSNAFKSARSPSIVEDHDVQNQGIPDSQKPNI